MAVLINNIVIIIISAGVTEICFSILRYVVVWDVKEGTGFVRAGLCKVDIYSRCGEELLICVRSITTVSTAILIRSSIATVVGISFIAIILLRGRDRRCRLRGVVRFPIVAVLLKPYCLSNLYL